MFLSQEQIKLVAIILVLIVAGVTTIKRLTGKDLLSPLLGRGKVMQAFYVIVAVIIIGIVYQLAMNKDDEEEKKNRLVSRMP